MTDSQINNAPDAGDKDLISIDGTIDHFIFQSELNAFCVAVFIEEGKRKKDKITAVGELFSIASGESVRLWGKWIRNPKFGMQFQVKTFIPILPASVIGIKKYLGSGLIKGIGKKFAERIVDHFGEKTLEIIDNEPDRLSEVNNIGPKRVSLVKTAWKEHRLIRDIMVFLQTYNISLNLASRIFREYAEKSIEVLREDPYRLALDIRGVGFKSADKIAQSMGIPKDSPERARAGSLHLLGEASSKNGHTFLFEDELLKSGTELLEVEEDRIKEAVRELSSGDRIVIDEIEKNRPSIFPRAIHVCEKGIAENIKYHSSHRFSPFRQNVDSAISAFEKQHNFTLASLQKEAVREAMKGGFLVITGGPGTGKTTIVRTIIHLLHGKNMRIKLAAPTGRAAKRLEETTSMPASTIHRLLKFKPSDGKFTFNEINPLPVDLLIVDESSMVDVVLAYHLLKALPRKASVIFVGDADQLPSVGPGNFLRDMISSGFVNTIRLNEIFRQAKQSLIVLNAHRINHGEFPITPKKTNRSQDFFFIYKKEPEEAMDAICRLIHDRIPQRFGFDPVRDIQLITPMYKGILGASNMNLELQNLLNPNPDYITKGSLRLRIGDKVMQLKNNYDKDVYNGDLGIVVSLDREYNLVNIRFEGRVIPYEFSDLDDITLAYAITVHKSQGSEYPAVVIPVHTQHFIMLQRNLLYTAITRGKRLVCLVGTKKALAIAIKNAEQAKRNSALGIWLASFKKSNPQQELPF
jgi:exodeoxyribonuclease V alpha subunit